jgi:hypothetical protein
VRIGWLLSRRSCAFGAFQAVPDEYYTNHINTCASSSTEGTASRHTANLPSWVEFHGQLSDVPKEYNNGKEYSYAMRIAEACSSAISRVCEQIT